MEQEVVFSMKTPFRDPLTIYGYRFGKGERSACIVGPTRGNEIQQLYICSQLIKVLTTLEKTGNISTNREVFVIPTVNYYSTNIEKRFFSLDNTDINRKFPGSSTGETTERIAAAIFKRVSGYSYGIQFASFHAAGDLIPHVKMMATGYESNSLASLFGMPYVVTRKPEPMDTKTLNYNWQLQGTNAFSVYTSFTDYIDEPSAKMAVSSVLRFLTRMGIIKYNCHNGYIASIIEEHSMSPIRALKSGIYRRLKNPGDEVQYKEILAEILDPMLGTVIGTVEAPSDGVIFFAHNKPLVMQNCVVYHLIRRLHT